MNNTRCFTEAAFISTSHYQSELVGDLPHDLELLPDDVRAEHPEAAVRRQDQPFPVNVEVR